MSRLVAWGGRRDDDVQIGSAEDIVAAAFASGDIDQVRVPGLVPFAALPDLQRVQALAGERGAVIFSPGRGAGKTLTMKAAAALPTVRRPERAGVARRRAKRRQLDAMRFAARVTLAEAKRTAPPELQADHDDWKDEDEWT